MKSLCKPSLIIILFFFLTAAAWSQCNPPATPGAVICTPTDGSTVVYNNEVSVMSTPVAGTTITKIIIYDNGTVIAQGKDAPGLNVYDGAMDNGVHHITFDAWDSAGTLYTAKTTFTVTGEGYDSCATPKSPGVVICSPPAEAVYGLSPTVFVAAKGLSPIKKITFALDGKTLFTQPNTASFGTAVQLPKQGVPYTLTVTATDSSGDEYSASKTLEAQYTYGQYSCFYTCPPGINVARPVAGAYVGNDFSLNVEIIGSTKPITSMKAYIDAAEVASSNGPQLKQEVTDAPSGTHILTVEGWDNDGTEFYYQENININVKD